MEILESQILYKKVWDLKDFCCCLKKSQISLIIMNKSKSVNKKVKLDLRGDKIL